jgi:Mn-dependent DtxR family transcriptional regulator
MQEKIGEVAGRIWKLLEEKDKVSISQIPKSLKETDAITYQALGWLAREGKIEYHTQKTKTSVSLKHAK